MQGNEPLLRIKDLCVEYHANDSVVKAVNHVTFDLEAGRTLGLVGETGSGKTTIAKSIMRILLEPPAKIRSGEILLNGQNLLKLNERDMRKVRGGEISMVFQDPMTALNPIAFVGDQIAEAIRLHEKIGKLDAKRKAAQMLEMVGIPAERYEEYPHQFSGGMKQRVVIAIALACNPHLLLADEPTTALDVTIQAQVLEMMDGLKQRLNTSMILITHDLGIVARSCDQVAIIYAGSLVEIGGKEDIFDHCAHPYTKGLFGCIPSIHMDNRRLVPIPGMIPDPTKLPEGCAFCPRCPYATAECSRDAIPATTLSPGHQVRCLHPVSRGE
ncbi:MAG: ABC transporter ATP-binding protein [Eubacteriales bacterium]|nr:ABC transporter ATP-binding protein [Eubacteriales bacterium]